MKRCFGLAVCLTAGVLLAGCRTPVPPKAGEPVIPEVAAAFTPAVVQIDGKLDDAVWKTATPYALSLASDQVRQGKRVTEPGTAQLAWDSNNLYVAVSFTDSDVAAEGTQDGQHHYQLGDVAEVFVWSEDQTWYLEMYVTPSGSFSTFFFPGGGRRLPSCFAVNAFPLRVAAQVGGTLNDWTDRDVRWTAEMAVPAKELVARGARWEPAAPWRVLVARYNYSRWLLRAELSEAPALPYTDFHLRDSYGRLRLMPEGTPEVSR